MRNRTAIPSFIQPVNYLIVKVGLFKVTYKLLILLLDSLVLKHTPVRYFKRTRLGFSLKVAGFQRLAKRAALARLI